jgi:hypothetical protein
VDKEINVSVPFDDCIDPLPHGLCITDIDSGTAGRFPKTAAFEKNTASFKLRPNRQSNALARSRYESDRPSKHHVRSVTEPAYEVSSRAVGSILTLLRLLSH